MFVHNDTIFPGDVIALGDIHGMARLYHQFLEWVKDSQAQVVLLGDLIDRGEDDLTVLNRTRDIMQDPEGWGLQSFTVLRGNHEQMFLNAAGGYGWNDWVRNGGDWENFEQLKTHVDWVSQLPYFMITGDTMFAHAGCYPGKDPQEFMTTHYLREQFVWMREPFLTRGPGFEQWNPNLKKIVFGHTPQSALPYRVPNGICIDTGAFHTGVLTAYNATQDTINQFDLEDA